MPLDLLALDLGDLERRTGAHLVRGGVGGRLISKVELVELLAVDVGQARGEMAAVRRGEVGLDRPVFARLERLDLVLALADNAQRHRLYAAGRAAARQLAPQHRRQGEAD